MKNRKAQPAGLAGKRVLITGAARHIGREIALKMAAAGADVAITYRSSRREAERTRAEVESCGVRALALVCDVREERSIRRVAETVNAKFGGIDVLVNNAAAYDTLELEKITVQQWDEMFDTNVRGPFLCSRLCARYLRKQQGKIINLGSLGGLRPWVTHAHYCQSKAALHMQTQLLAKAFAPQISVNCVAPGLIDFQEKSPGAFMRKMAKKTPMQRNGTNQDVAAAVMFFATAPAFITGQILIVDGGLSLV